MRPFPTRRLHSTLIDNRKGGGNRCGHHWPTNFPNVLVRICAASQVFVKYDTPPIAFYRNLLDFLEEVLWHMAHLDRHRYVEPHIAQALSFSSIVGVVGQRQVGKTTTVEKHKPDAYVTLDDDAALSSAQSEPTLFLRHGMQGDNFLLAIDECQKAPKLFPALKLYVQRRPRPGQFLLTGSIRFTSRKAIQESLTGRIHTIEMLPMSFAESHRHSLGDIIKISNSDGEVWRRYLANERDDFSPAKMEKFLLHGGLPGICFLREQGKRDAKFKSHIETLLQRDIRLIADTSVPYENLRSLLAYFAAHQGESFNLANAARASQISQVTLRKIIFAFENLFLLRRLISFGDVTSPRFYFEDQGMASYLHGFSPLEDLRRFLFSQIFNQIHYRYMDVYRVGYFANRGGANISFIFEVKKKLFGFDVFEGETPNLSLLRSSESFLKQFPKAVVFLFSATAKVMKINERVKILPLAAVL